MTCSLLAPPDRREATRRDFLTLIGAAGLLGACSAPAPDAPAAAGYPLTVTTPDDGPVTIERAPRRIAALNGNRVVPFLLPFLSAEHQLVGYGNGTVPEDFPWITAQLRASTLFDGLEGCARLRPDILIANGNVGDAWEPYRALGTLLQLPETDWRATTRLLGTVFTDPDAAERTVAEAEARIAGARRTTPITATVFSPYADDGTVGTQGRGAELPNFLADLNITVAPAVSPDGYDVLSLERLTDALDVDHVIVLNNGDDLLEEFLAQPLLVRSPVSARGRVTVFDPQQFAAGFPVTPPTIPVLLDALAPLLRA